MIKIKRTMQSETIGEVNLLHSSQASFNSDGNITIRNYDPYNKDKDEIIILSERETKAVIELFRKIGQLRPNELPF